MRVDDFLGIKKNERKKKRENGDGGASEKAPVRMGVRAVSCREKKKMQEEIGVGLVWVFEVECVCYGGDRRKKNGEKRWVVDRVWC